MSVYQSIPVVRGGDQVRTFISALGFSRETRLTAILGYLVSQAPNEFMTALVGRRSRIYRVCIEAVDENRRYDVFAEGPSGAVVIEAKVGFQQHLGQIRAYLALAKKVARTPVDLVLLDRGSEPFATELRELRAVVPKGCRLIFRRWGDIVEVCRALSRRSAFQKEHPLASAIAGDFAAHLEEENMDRVGPREVYVRQLRGSSLDLFFRHGVYKCQARFGPYASQHRYFAPLFTAQAPVDMMEYSPVPIKAGLSWVAPIRAAQTLRYSDLGEFLKQQNVPDPQRAAELIPMGYRKRAKARRRSRRGEVFILVLGKPFNLFTVPLSTKALGVRGMLAQKSLSFAELFRIAETAR